MASLNTWPKLKIRIRLIVTVSVNGKPRIKLFIQGGEAIGYDKVTLLGLLLNYCECPEGKLPKANFLVKCENWNIFREFCALVSTNPGIIILSLDWGDLTLRLFDHHSRLAEKKLRSCELFKNYGQFTKEMMRESTFEVMHYPGI